VALRTDPASARRVVEGMGDETTQAVALTALVYGSDVSPDELSELCPMFSHQVVVERCERYHTRRHLFDSRPRASGPGASEPEHTPPPTCDGSCPLATEPAQCNAYQALDVRGEGVPPAQGCDCASLPLERMECRFWYAETLVERTGILDVAEAAAVCLDAGSLAQDCLHHLAAALAKSVPAPDPSAFEDWELFVSAVGQLDGTVRERGDGQRAEILTGIVWSDTIHRSLGDRADFPVELLGLLPAGATPHLRAALAWHTVAVGLDGSDDLQRLVAILEQAEVSGSVPDGPEGQATTRIPTMYRPELYHETQPRPGSDSENLRERRQQSIPYLGMGHRIRSPEAVTDRIICLIEAAVRIDPEAATPLLQAAGARSEPELRWVASQLGAWLAGEGPADGPRALPNPSSP